MSSSSYNFKQPNRAKTSSSSFVTTFIIFFSGALTASTLLWMFPLTSNPYTSPPTLKTSNETSESPASVADEGPTFYDDPQLSYMIGDSMDNWDEKREDWLQKNPGFGNGGKNRAVSDRMLIVTGSQLKPCKNPVADNLLLRSFKNKVDYCRINGYDIFYNNLLLQPEMNGAWAKLPAIRALMLAHPETEWFLWMDVDAFFTDMDFKFPFNRYEDHNFVVQGWNTYEKRSYTSLNAGVFLIRNCQWSIDFIDVWSRMSPLSPDYDKWGRIQRSMFKDKTNPDPDDQSALLYLMLKKRKIWGDKIFLEEELNFQSHWVGVIDNLDNFTRARTEKDRIDRKHAEKSPNGYDTAGRVKERGWLGPPVMIHFAGCQPCSGKHNPDYGAEDCWEGMSKALTFADNQVVRNFGLVHLNLSNASSDSLLNKL